VGSLRSILEQTFHPALDSRLMIFNVAGYNQERTVMKLIGQGFRTWSFND